MSPLRKMIVFSIAGPLLLASGACQTARTTTLGMPETPAGPPLPLIEGIAAGLYDEMLSFTLSGEPEAQLQYSLNGGAIWRDYNEEVFLSDPGIYLVQVKQLTKENISSETSAIIRLVVFDGDILLPPFVSDGMVLQRNVEVPIFGYCNGIDDVTVAFRSASVTAHCIDGEWEAWLPAMNAGGPWPLTIEGATPRVIENVYVGDVWLAAGQSNMGSESLFSPDEFDAVDIHFFSQSLSVGNSEWKSTAEPFVFSTIATHFARFLQPYVGVPIGIILASDGSTRSSVWQSGGGAKTYDLLVGPIPPYPIMGVLWWQGESDALSASAEYYSEGFSRMITGWRDAWDIGDFPFIFVQMQRISDPDINLNWPVVRQGQLEALSLNNTGMVVSFDLTDGDLHPTNKEPIAARLALAARAIAYGESLDYSGPVFDSASVEGNRITLAFDHVADGLMVTGDKLVGFELMDGSDVYSTTAATIQGDEVVITVEGLTGAFRVRYGYRNYPEGNLYNSAGLPASPFMTEPWWSRVHRR